MSWNVNLSGKPEEIEKALEAESANLSGQSKVEFDEAKPHLVALVRQNFVDSEEPSLVTPSLKLEASGNGSAKDGRQTRRSCSVRLRAS